eukprot:17784-Heterococcus_DN1.PRE.1
MPRDPASEQLSQWKATNGNAKQACVLHVKRGQCSAVAALVPAPVSKKTMVQCACLCLTGAHSWKWPSFRQPDRCADSWPKGPNACAGELSQRPFLKATKHAIIDSECLPRKCGCCACRACIMPVNNQHLITTTLST